MAGKQEPDMSIVTFCIDFPNRNIPSAQYDDITSKLIYKIYAFSLHT